jgi:hypothetical protein
LLTTQALRSRRSPLGATPRASAIAAIAASICLAGLALAGLEVGTAKLDRQRYNSNVGSVGTPYSREGPFLDWGREAPWGPELGGRQRLDANGVPLVRDDTADGTKFVYDPLRIIQYGLQEISYFDFGKGAGHLSTARRMGDWLVRNQDRASGLWPNGPAYTPRGARVSLGRGWPSALVQGQALSLLTRLYSASHNPAYLAAAVRAVRPFELSVGEGGVRASLRGHPLYEEYPTRPPSLVLNGFILSLLGLYDLSPYSAQADHAYRLGRDTLADVLPLYDVGRRGSAYNLVGLTGAGPSNVYATCGYTRFHVVLLDAMNSIDPRAVYRHYRDRWARLPCGNTPETVQTGFGQVNLRWLIPISTLVLAAVISILLLRLRRVDLAWWCTVLAHVAAAALAGAVWLRLGFQVAAKSSLSVDGLALATIAIIGVCGSVAASVGRVVLAGSRFERSAPAALCIASAAGSVLVAATNLAFIGLGLAGLVLSGIVVWGRHAHGLRGRARRLLLALAAGGAALGALASVARHDRGSDLAALGRSIPDGASVAIAVLAGLGCVTLVVWALRTARARTRSQRETGGLRLAMAPYAFAVVVPVLLLTLARVLQLLLPLGGLSWPAAVAALSLAAMTAGNAAALSQRDPLRILGYGSVAQIGFALAGISSLTSADGLPATVFFIVGYALATVAAIGTVAVITKDHATHDVASLQALAGHRWLGGAFLLAVSSLAGVPPLPGFFGRVRILEAANGVHGAWFVAAAAVNAVLSVAVYARLIAPVVQSIRPASTPAAPLGPGRVATCALLVAGFGLVVASGLTAQLIDFASNAVAWGG